MFRLVVTLAVSLGLSLGLTAKDGDRQDRLESLETIVAQAQSGKIRIYDADSNLIKEMMSEDEDRLLLKKADLILDDGKDKIFIVYTR